MPTGNVAFTKKARRTLLFAVTLITILLVLLGTVFFTASLEKNPVTFVIFWTVCFVFAMAVIALAIFDMRMLRKEFRRRQTELDAELAGIMEEAREEAARQKEDN